MPKKIIWISILALLPQVLCVGMMTNDLKSGNSLGLAVARGWWLAGFGWAILAVIPFLVTRHEISKLEKMHREAPSGLYLVLMFHALCLLGGISIIFLPCFKSS